MKYDKLVRDKIPDILDAHGKNYSIRQCQDDEKFEYLKQKLVEEVDEFLQEPSAEELADIQEVILCISAQMGITRRGLESVRKTKVAQRGAFSDNWILEEVV
jgi:predicted house-cleaning noncanonical NTP pyrophosphatase (MazG superfamily)